ncbi:MAG: SDR family oxidoreductase [Pseudomonadota bacterium]
MADLDGKIAIVTGAAKGIGYAIARRLLQDGCRVAIADVDKAKGKQAEKELEDIGPTHFFAVDVSNRLDVHNLVAGVIDLWGDIDILVNNAAIVHAADFLELAEDDFDQVLNVNLKGTFLVGQAVAEYMVEKVKGGGHAGSIVNMSSINAKVAIPNQVPYCVSKGGVNQLTKVMALSLAPHGIRVNAVGPGSIATEMLTSVTDNAEARKGILSRTPLGRVGDVTEVASIVSFLASREAGYMTGEILYADGGRLALNYTVDVPDDD